MLQCDFFLQARDDVGEKKLKHRSRTTTTQDNLLLIQFASGVTGSNFDALHSGSESAARELVLVRQTHDACA